MNRTGWLSILLLACVGLGVAIRRWPEPALPELACAPERVRLDELGVARCDPVEDGAPLTVEARLGLGGRLDLNRAREDELARLPGVGRQVARALVEERAARGPFVDWFEVESVRGVGPTRLRALQASAEIR